MRPDDCAQVLIDAGGYVKLIDFGFAKVVDGGHTCTCCGTADYMAPELLRMRAHAWEVDVWALGVLVFEMTTGYAPFASWSPHETCEKILRFAERGSSVPFPWFYPQEAADFISRLLVADGAKRPSAVAATRLPFVRSIAVEAVETRRLPPPFLPTLTDPFDASLLANFSDEGADADGNGQQQATAAGAGSGAPANNGTFPGFMFSNVSW